MTLPEAEDKIAEQVQTIQDLKQLLVVRDAQLEECVKELSDARTIIEQQQQQLELIHKSIDICNKTLVHVLGKLEPNFVLSVQKAATSLSNQRKHVLWCTEERNKLNRRVAMLEAAIEASISDLRIWKASGATLQHYERILRNDWPFLEGKG